MNAPRIGTVWRKATRGWRWFVLVIVLSYILGTRALTLAQDGTEPELFVVGCPQGKKYEEAQFGKGIGEYVQQHTDPEAMQRCQAILFGAG